MQKFTSPHYRILIIDDNSPFVLPLLRSFSGHKHILLDVLLSTQKALQGFKYSRYLENLHTVSKLDKDNFLEVVLEKVNQLHPDMIIPTREWISKLLFRHKTALEKITRLHPLPDASTLEITGDKWNLNNWLKKNGFPAALTSEITSSWDGEYPVLIKPVFGIGGKGIRVFNNNQDLLDALKNKKKYEKGFFLQEFLEGYDIDISFFAVKGKILYHTIQRGLISAHLEYSKGIEFIKNEPFFKLASSIVEKLNYTGIAHLDFRYSSEKQEYVLIDFNARYWSSVQGSRAMGVNFPVLVVNYVMNNRLENLEYRTGHYYFATTALKIKFKNLFSRSKLPVRLRDTQLYFVYRDPLPELMFVYKKIMGSFNQSRTES